ncbi:MAG: hypothetical protein WB586_23745 [Chthoniobacterales bacterium]
MRKLFLAVLAMTAVFLPLSQTAQAHPWGRYDSAQWHHRCWHHGYWYAGYWHPGYWGYYPYGPGSVIVVVHD